MKSLQTSSFGNSFAPTPDGKQVLIHTSNGLKLYDFLTATEIQHFPEITSATRIVVSPDGKSFLTTDHRGDTAFGI